MADTEFIPGMGTIEDGGVVVEEGPTTIEPITAGSSQPIGTVESSACSVTVHHTDGSTEQLEAGSPIFQGDQLETSADGSVGVVLADGTSFSMAESCKMVMDEMVYDPATQEGSIGIQAVEGVFTFVSGQIAKTDPDAMTLETPVATIGIRGTQVGIEVGEGGQSNVVLMEEADGFVGEVTVSNAGGLQILNNALQGTSIVSQNSAPSESFFVDQKQMLNTFGGALGSLPATGNNNNYNQAPPEQGAVEESDTEETVEEAALEEEALEEQLAEEEKAQEEIAEEDLGEEQFSEEELTEEALGEESLTEEDLGEEATTEEALAEEDADEDLDNFETASGGEEEELGQEVTATDGQNAPEALAEEDGGSEGSGMESFEMASGGDEEELGQEVTATDEQDATEALADFDGSGQGNAQDETDGIENFETAAGGDEEGPTDEVIRVTGDGGDELNLTLTTELETETPTPPPTTPDPDPDLTPEPEPTPTPDPPSAPIITRHPESVQVSENGTQSIDLEVQSTGTDPVSSVQLVGLLEGSTLILGTEEDAETIFVGSGPVSLSPSQLEGLQFQPPADYNTNDLEGNELIVTDGAITLTPDQPDGITFTPPADASGTFSLDLSATDSDGEVSALGTADVVVAAVDDLGVVDGGGAGDEGTAIELNLTAAMAGETTEEITSVTVSDIPTGVVLHDAQGNELTVTDSAITPPANSADDFDLTLSATDSDGGAVATGTATSEVTDVADAPDISGGGAGDEDTAIGLNLAVSIPDATESDESVTISNIPEGAILSAGTVNDDGSVTLTPDQLSDLTITPIEDSGADFNLTVTATSTDGVSTEETVEVVVDAVADAPTVSLSIGDPIAIGADDKPGHGFGDTNQDHDGPHPRTGNQGEGDGEGEAGTDGNDGSVFPLDLSASLTDTDTSETLSVTVSGVPEGAELSAGTDNGDGSWTLGPDDLEGLNLFVPEGISSDFSLTATATATDTDPDTGAVTTASASDVAKVGLDTVAEAPDLGVTAAAGNGDTAIPLDINAALADDDGSEVLSVTVAGVPAGASLSAGADNGDGSWTLTADDLSGLTITPPDDSNDDFDLSITATSTELLGGDTATTTTTLSVDVTGVADAPELDVALGDGTITTEPTNDPSGGDKPSHGDKPSRGGSRGDKPSGGDTPSSEVSYPLDVSALLTDDDGSETLSVTVAGLPDGASLSAGTDNGDDSFTLSPDELSGLTLTVPLVGAEDFTMSVSATSAEDDGDTSIVTVDVPVALPDGEASTPTLTVSDAAGDEDTAIDLNVDAALTYNDGSEALSVTIAGVPEGASLSAGTDSGDGSWTLDGDQIEGLTITPAEDRNDDFSLTVTATSTETGGSDTATTSATIDVDVTGVADRPEVTVQNDSGNEDQWIQLHLDSAVSDTDGSESLRISISNVPDGATLSPGSNSGDGTWSVSADELPSVCILPPVDFKGQMNMTLNVTATENGGDTATATESFVVTVDPTADVPVVIGSGSGAEYTAIDLALLATVSGVETVESVTISGVSDGAIISAGTPNEDGSITLTPDELVGLTITPPADFNGSLEISVSAVSTDGSESAAVPVSISVSAVPDFPVVSLSAASGDEDSAIALDITAGVPNSTETVKSVTISGVLDGASLSAGTDKGNGSWTLPPSDLSGLTLTPTQDLNGSVDLTVSAISTDGGQSDGANLNVDVEPVPESTNLNFTVSNESIDDASQSLDLSDLTPDDFGATDTVEFEGGETEVTYLDADTAFAEFTNAWGEVSDIDADSDVAADVTIAKFADVDVDLGDGGDITVTIDGAAQGDISTGDGDDVVDVDALSIGDDWSNLFSIDTVDASDQVTVSGDQGVTEIDVDTGAGSDTITLDGNYTEAVVDAGDGNDVIVGGSGDDVILAGAGDDLMSGGSGSDVLDGGEGTDTLQLSNSYDDYNISFDGEQIIVSGPEGVDTVTGVELLEFADGTLAVEDIGLEPVVSLTTFGSDEDTAIAIDIGVYVANPFEGVATVSISGVPECADLLAGTDNGGGNWTLSAGDLDGLTVTPPQDFFGQLDLSVSATSTEGVTSLAAPLPVDFAAVNDAPVLEGDETLEVDTGGTATITSEDFNVTDVDNDPSDITYTVTDGPDNGTLFLDGDALDEDDIFTQEDIDNGLLQYTADEAGFSWAENTPSWDEGGAPVDQSNLTVPETAEGVTVVFEGESAENHNTVGWYKLDENGDPMEPQVLFVDASEEGNTLEKGTEITLEGLEPGEQFGFFIIQDGANKYPNLAEAVEAGVPLNFDDNGNITFESSALVGTDDNDVLTGGIGADIIDGGDGDDTIIGGSDDDYLYGGEGDDVLSGGAGNDIIDGGCDDDTLILSGNLEDYIITRVGGTFTIEDTREDGDGTDRVEHVEEFEFADQTLSKDDLRNESENLEQRGNRGDNELTGTDGDDKLKGDRGDDILEGGAGDDEIKGGSGDDTAVFSGDLSDYTITQDGDSFFVSDNREDGDGTDEVKEVKSFQFNDQTVSKDDMEDIAEKVSGEHSSVTIEASNIFFTGEGLNTDGANHAISGTNDDGNLMIGFEDLTGGGDNDFNDATISVKYEGVDNGATADTFGIKASDGEDELQENDGSDGGYSVTDGEAAVSVVIDPSGIG
jgi:hypothetical protein